jgi:hypothetical protein
VKNMNRTIRKRIFEALAISTGLGAPICAMRPPGILREARTEFPYAPMIAILTAGVLLILTRFPRSGGLMPPSGSKDEGPPIEILRNVEQQGWTRFTLQQDARYLLIGPGGICSVGLKQWSKQSGLWVDRYGSPWNGNSNKDEDIRDAVAAATALSRVLRAPVNVQPVIAISGPYIPGTRTEIQGVTLIDIRHIHGWLTHLPPVFDDAQLHCLTNRSQSYLSPLAKPTFAPNGLPEQALSPLSPGGDGI